MPTPFGAFFRERCVFLEDFEPSRHFSWVQPLLLQGFFGALNEGMQPLLPINGPAQLKEKLEHILTVCWMNSH